MTEWQPISTVPRDYRWVIIAAFDSDNRPDFVIGSRWEGFWQGWKGSPPTHWMPVPPSPVSCTVPQA